MTARAPSRVLGDLLALAAAVRLKPYSAFGLAEHIDAIHAEIVRHLERPCEGERFIDETATWLAQSLRNVAIMPSGAPRWLAMAEFLAGHLEAVRRAAAEAELAPPVEDAGRYR